MMNNLKFIRQKTLEKHANFDKRLSEAVNQSWKTNSFTSDHVRISVLLERDR